MDAIRLTGAKPAYTEDQFIKNAHLIDPRLTEEEKAMEIARLERIANPNRYIVSEEERLKLVMGRKPRQTWDPQLPTADASLQQLVQIMSDLPGAMDSAIKKREDANKAALERMAPTGRKYIGRNLLTGQREYENVYDDGAKNPAKNFGIEELKNLKSFLIKTMRSPAAAAAPVAAANFDADGMAQAVAAGVADGMQDVRGSMDALKGTVLSMVNGLIEIRNVANEFAKDRVAGNQVMQQMYGTMQQVMQTFGESQRQAFQLMDSMAARQAAADELQDILQSVQPPPPPQLGEDEDESLDDAEGKYDPFEDAGFKLLQAAGDPDARESYISQQAAAQAYKENMQTSEPARQNPSLSAEFKVQPEDVADIDLNDHAIAPQHQTGLPTITEQVQQDVGAASNAAPSGNNIAELLREVQAKHPELRKGIDKLTGKLKRQQLAKNRAKRLQGMGREIGPAGSATNPIVLDRNDDMEMEAAQILVEAFEARGIAPPAIETHERLALARKKKDAVALARGGEDRESLKTTLKQSKRKQRQDRTMKLRVQRTKRMVNSSRFADYAEGTEMVDERRSGLMARAMNILSGEQAFEIDIQTFHEAADEFMEIEKLNQKDMHMNLIDALRSDQDAENAYNAWKLYLKGIHQNQNMSTTLQQMEVDLIMANVAIMAADTAGHMSGMVEDQISDTVEEFDVIRNMTRNSTDPRFVDLGEVVEHTSTTLNNWTSIFQDMRTEILTDMEGYVDAVRDGVLAIIEEQHHMDLYNNGRMGDFYAELIASVLGEAAGVYYRRHPLQTNIMAQGVHAGRVRKLPRGDSAKYPAIRYSRAYEYNKHLGNNLNDLKGYIDMPGAIRSEDAQNQFLRRNTTRARIVE